MLYDPKWEKKTKADPFTLENLIAWLERQPADEIYCYTDIGHCLIAQYLNAQGICTKNVNPKDYYDEHWVSHPLPCGFNAIASCEPHTFGAALERARARRSTPSPNGIKP